MRGLRDRARRVRDFVVGTPPAAPLQTMTVVVPDDVAERAAMQARLAAFYEDGGFAVGLPAERPSQDRVVLSH